MALQTTWNLDQTSNSLIGVSKGALHAATTDNVQPLAILACEQFGNTLAMCPETLHKIERSVLPMPEPRILSFAKSTIGWSKNDCISYFGENIAGLQFLGLAATLVTHRDLYRAGQTIQALLAGTARDKTLLPTARQLTHLLASLESRCHLAGFADEVEGWQLLLAKHPSLADTGWDIRLGLYNQIPNSNVMVNLVDALRQLSRVGRADITGITLKTSSCIPWTIGFVKWSLGQPPSIRCERNDSMILEQLDSRVTVIISDSLEVRGGLSITIHSSIQSPSELVATGGHQEYAGMVDLQTYGQGLLHDYGCTSGLAKEAFQQAVPLALCQAMTEISSRSYDGEEWPESTSSGMVPDTSGPVFLKEKLGFSPFRSYETILRIYKLLFDHELPPEANNSGQDISSLHHVTMLIEICQCETCTEARDAEGYIPCRKKKFFRELGSVVADVLSLSLINDPEHLKVSALPDHSPVNGQQSFEETISLLLQGERVTGVGLKFALCHCLELLGHHNTAWDWAVTSAKGQVVWPTIFETLSFSKQGYASISWCPGLVRHQGETFNWVISSRRSSFSQTIYGNKLGKPRACNLFPDMKWQWMVSMEGDCLQLGMDVMGSSMCHGTGLGVCKIIPNLSITLLVRSCSHSPTADLEPEVSLDRLHFSGPFGTGSPGPWIHIVPVDGDTDLRFLALAQSKGERPIVLRHRACMACCLDVCKKVGATVLIL